MQPYPFQRQVADLLLGGQNVILQAPTGAGKTRAALLPFEQSFMERRGFPRKCLYTVPMRVLANQFVDEFGGMAPAAPGLPPPGVGIQTGERPEDRELAAGLTFATIDQALSSFLLVPYSLPRRLANMNAGAVAASYLVFDEFHLFDPESTLPTTLEMLRMLRGVSPFLLMTATFSTEMLSGLASALGAVVVPSDSAGREEMGLLPSQQKVRRYHAADVPLSAGTVLEHHSGRTLVVCNTVERAQTLFESLRSHPSRGGTEVLLLHSRFLPEDRKRVESRVRNLFGRGGDPATDCILVATQAIEVGLDITCRTLHTELAPANAIVQRAGRCARYSGEEGDVHVYSTAFARDGEPVDLAQHVMPYREQKSEIALTLSALRARNGCRASFADEQSLVSQAHGPRDRLIVSGLVAAREMHRRRIIPVLRGQTSGDAGNLIRQVSSRTVVVHDDPAAVAQRPFSAESFALHPGTLRGLAGRWLERAREMGLTCPALWVLDDPGDPDQSGSTRFTWKPVRGQDDVSGAVLVLVHPGLAGYDPETGFVADRGTGFRSRLAPGEQAPEPARYSYQLEGYEPHVERVAHALRLSAWPELSDAAGRLERACGWPAGVMGRAAHLAVLLHDVGKLSCAWQEWVARYQLAIGRPAPPGLFAHTDFDPQSALHVQRQREAGTRPPHAMEGAVAAAPLLASALAQCEPVFLAAFTAIARHHGPFTEGFRSYRLVPGSRGAVQSTLQRLLPAETGGLPDAADLDTADNPARTQVDDCLIDPQHEAQFLAYALLARALRRADQEGTGQGRPDR